MVRRRCDEYASCEECDWYNSSYTEKIKQLADEQGYETAKEVLELARLGGMLSWMPGYEHTWGYAAKSDGELYRIPICTKEQNCLYHYCNPDGICGDDEYRIILEGCYGNSTRKY